MVTREAELRQEFAEWMRELTADYLPRECFCDRFGLGLGAVRDLEQGRVLPSRAMLLVMYAIALDADFMRDVAKRAKDDLAALKEVRGKRRAAVQQTSENGPSADGL